MRSMFMNEAPWGRDGDPRHGGRNEGGHGRHGGPGGHGHGPRGMEFGGGPGEDDFGFGPGMAGMPGMPGFGGRGGRGPGRGRRGDVRNAVLALLAEEPMNGYQIISAIRDKSQGLWRPGPGSVYPALNLLTDEGLVESVDLDGKPAHTLSEAGKAYVAEHADEVNAPWERVAEPHKGFLDIRAEIGPLAMAITQVAQAGKPEQIDAARAILAQARKDIYRILADD